MLAVTCSLTGDRRLLDVNSIITVDNGPEGPVAIYRCVCGAIEHWPPDRPLSMSPPDGLERDTLDPR